MVEMLNPKPGEFAETYCLRCEAGWKRRATAETRIATTILCKLDMEQVNPYLFECSSFEPKDLLS